MGPRPHQADMTEDRTARAQGSPRRPEASVFISNLLIFIWWDVPAASFLFVSAVFFVVALLLDVLVLTSPASAAGLPLLSGVTLVLGLLTAYGVRAYQSEKQRGREADVPKD